MSGYSQALEVVATIYDPDKETGSSDGLEIEFTCSNLNTGNTCQDVEEKDLILNTTESS